jgi:hypothetical protein
MRAPILAAGALALAGFAVAHPAAAQRQTIEIRGQVPTPQIVTVRPREVPEFTTQVLVPAFYDHQFWPVILPAYQIVSRNEVRGVMPTDSMPSVTGGAVPATGAAVTPQTPPAARPPGGVVDTAARPAVPPATQNEEIEALRRELEARRARIDSIDAARKRQLDSLEQAIRERQRQVRPDTTVRPPGTSPAPSR